MPPDLPRTFPRGTLAGTEHRTRRIRPTSGSPDTACPVSSGRCLRREIGGVTRLVEEGRDGKDVATQLAAVSRALDRAGFAIVSTRMRQCLSSPDGMNAEDRAAMQKLVPTLS